MRAILLILILVVVAVIAAIATGLVDISQTRSAQVPEIETTEEGVRASGGQTPAFDVETGSLSVGAREQNVTLPVPTVDVNPPEDAGTGNGGPQVANDQAAAAR